MKIKNIIALLAAVSLLTACGKVSNESKTEIQTHDASVSAEENSDNEKATIPSDYDGAEYWDADGNPITLADTEESTAEISEVDDEMQYEACSVRPQCAPSFGVDFELPYDWSCETIQTDDDPTSSISVCLKPNTEADGSIILEYTKGGIEVSNSALSEIETEFNGYPATEGTYLCSEQWDHIFLKGDYEGCAVLNNANDWYDKYANEIEYILSTVEFIKYD